MVLNVVVIIIGILLMIRNLVSTQAFNIGLALTILGLTNILIIRSIDTD